MSPKQNYSGRSMFVFKKQVELAAAQLKISQGEILKKINSLPVCPAKTIGEAYNLFNNTEPGNGENVVALSKIVELFFIDLAKCKNLDELYSLEIYTNLDAVPESDKKSMIQAYDLKWDEFSLKECEKSNTIDEHVNAFRRSRKNSNPSVIAKASFNKLYSEEIGKFNTSFELRTLADKYEGKIINEDTRHECRLKYKKLCYFEAEDEINEAMAFQQLINAKSKAEESDDGFILSNKIQEDSYRHITQALAKEEPGTDYRLLFSHSNSRLLKKKVLGKWLCNTDDIFDLIDINFQSSIVNDFEDHFYKSKQKIFSICSEAIDQFSDPQYLIDFLVYVFNKINIQLIDEFKLGIFNQNSSKFLELINKSSADQVDYFFVEWRNEQSEELMVIRYFELSNTPAKVIRLLNLYKARQLNLKAVSIDDILSKLDKMCIDILDKTKDNDPGTVKYLIKLTEHIDGLNFTTKAYGRYLTMM